LFGIFASRFVIQTSGAVAASHCAQVGIGTPMVWFAYTIREWGHTAGLDD